MPSLSNVRPFQLALMAIFGLAALIGLFVFANYNGISSSGPKVGTVTIWGTLPGDVISAEIATVTTNNKSFSKVSYVQKQAATFDADLANAIASGSGPDMIIISQEQLLAEQSKINTIPASSIPTRTFTDSYLPEFQLFLSNSGTYGVPYVLDPMVLYYNKTILAQSGVPFPPSSWEGITGLAPTLSKKNGSAIQQSTIPFGSYDNTENARGILSLLFMQSGTPITQASQYGVRSALEVDPSSGASQTGQSAPAESAIAFYTQFADSARTVYSWSPSFSSARQAFISGTVAFYPGYASEEPLLMQANPNLPFDMAQIPQLQTASIKTDYGLAYVFAIPKASQNSSGAYLAARALSDPSVLGGVASKLSMAPALKGLLISSSTDIYSPVYYPEALISTGWLSPAPGTTDGIFSSMISNVTSGRYSIRTALQTADQALTASLSH
jgi:ABC-type glycerol-3-phosphate transport system substrate-binding protein